MTVTTILEEIHHLPIDKIIFIIEETIKSIKNNKLFLQMNHAANELYEEYKTNHELTAFTSLDMENFYEAK